MTSQPKTKTRQNIDFKHKHTQFWAVLKQLFGSQQVNLIGNSFWKSYIFETFKSRQVNLIGNSFWKGYIFETFKSQQVNLIGNSFWKGNIFETFKTR